jgi:hypothetical protein
MNSLSAEDIAALRADGDLEGYLRSLIGRPAKPKPAALAAVPDPGYRLAHVGGWPLDTAATGPTPTPDVCTCVKCGGNPASRDQHRDATAA